MEISPGVYLAGIVALGVSAQWLAWRLRLPAIVLLLAFGFAIGQVAGPDQIDEIIAPELLFAIVSLSVAIILFEGALSLQFSEVRETGRTVTQLVTVGVLVTWFLTTIAAQLFLDFDLMMAMLAGALFTVSGPTVIIPLLRHVRPERRIGSLVKWEGIVNDPIGAVLAALVFEVVLHGRLATAAEGITMGDTALGLLKTAVVGGVLAAITAALLIQLLKRYLIADFLQNAVILAMVLVVFTISNHLQAESGLVTVTLLGVILANQQSVTLKHVIEFKENLRVLLISTLFIVLASRIELGDMLEVGWGGVAFLVALLLVVRPAAVFLATLGSQLTYRERLLLAWIHPRGIVAAAVASLVALEIATVAAAEPGVFSPQMIEKVERLVPLTFFVIVGTVTVYGLTLGPLSRLLGLSRQNPQGVIFAGAQPFSRAIAHALAEEGYQTLMVDTNPRNIAAARMAGLPVCFASIGSEYVHEEIDLGEIGRLLAMTPNDEVNTLATLEFADHFSRAEVYQLAPPDASSERNETVLPHRRGRLLFGPDVTYGRLAQRQAEGAVIKKTRLSEDFSYDDFLKRYGPTATVLFLIEESGNLTVVTAEKPPAPKPGQTLVCLVDAIEESDEDDAEPEG